MRTTVPPTPDTPSLHAIYFCRVGHARLHPFRHAFTYRVYSLLLDLDRLDVLPWPLSHNKANLFGFHDKDHGARDGSPLRPWVEARLAEAGVRLEGGAIRILCFPRVLGYTFNPLSTYFCHGPDGRLRAVLYEVKNTFGDQHTYVAPVSPQEADAGVLSHGHAKEFHVSPFMDIAGGYRFALSVPGESLSIRITHADAKGDLMLATQTGRRRDLTAGALVKAFLTHPLVTLKVIGAIHWEAFHLWRKGAKFHSRPEPPIRLATPDRRHTLSGLTEVVDP